MAQNAGKPGERTFFATTAKAMEPLLAEELKSLGCSRIELGRAGVAFAGTLDRAYRVCLWSRIANRVLLPIDTFYAPTPERLYGGVKAIRWSDHIGKGRTIAVDFSANASQITHTHYGALKTKDAICDQLRSVRGERPNVDPLDPDVRINVYVREDEATVSLDLSGQSLHRRGYREEGVAAPLKENLAAAILMLLGWKGGPDRAFLDPMCGSGTLPLEAALIATRTAPGLTQKKYGFMGWEQHDPEVWRRLLEQAEAAKIRDPKAAKLERIIGTDENPRAVHAALANLERSGLPKGLVHFEKRTLAEAQPHAPRGVIVANPPYGERLGEIEALKPVYKEFGDLLKQRFKGWDAGIFTGSSELAKSVGLKTSRKHPLYNGPIECRLLTYALY